MIQVTRVQRILLLIKKNRSFLDQNLFLPVALYDRSGLNFVFVELPGAEEGRLFITKLS